MIKPLFQSMCKQARTYYYDYICEENGEPIPPEITAHIDKCQHCQAATNKFRYELIQGRSNVEQSTTKADSALIAMLKLHFAYIDEPVSCNIVKPFLPTLFVKVLGMRIPTPIVAHVYNCQQCLEDLQIIRCLELNRKQLYRLSQLFADKPDWSNISCTEAQCAIPSVVSMAFNETDLEVLKHLCTCSVCRRLVYKERQKLCDSLQESAPSQEFPCESVSTRDLFDYVVPYGINPANDQYAQYAKFRKSFTSHVITCSNCLARMQQLHNTVYYIIERTESEAVTIYHIDESAKAQTIGESDDIYAGFPIRVEKASQDNRVSAWQRASRIDFGAVIRQKIMSMNLKPLVKTTAAAAAIVLVAAALFFYTPAAKAVTIDKLYEAISNIKNVYIAKFTPDGIEPKQEIWVSRILNIYMTKTENKMVLWDVINCLKKMKDLSTGAFETTSVDEETIASIKMKMSGYLGLVPFTSISNIPADAQWKQITDKSQEYAAKDIEIYDLIWTEETRDSSKVLKKWRVFVDPKTNLPKRTEFYEKLPTDSKHLLQSVNVVEYLDHREIQSVFN